MSRVIYLYSCPLSSQVDEQAIEQFPFILHSDKKEMCEEAEVDLVYLPPYSPDLSPIEESFNGLKPEPLGGNNISQQLVAAI